MSDPSSPKVARPAERMTAEQFFHDQYDRFFMPLFPPGILRFAEAFAEHCTAAMIEYQAGAFEMQNRTIRELEQRAESAEASLAASAKEVEKLRAENNRLVGELTAISGCDGFRCGLIHGIPKPFIGGCGEHVSFADAYRCADCTASFHRECINQHFEMDAYVKNLRDIRATGAVDGWKKAVADAESKSESSAALVRELAQTLEYAIEDLRNGWTPRTGLVPHTEALLSREDVKKVLEE